MKQLFRSSLALLLAIAALAVPATGSAAPTSTSFTILGYEYAFTSTVGSFAGIAHGNAGDTGTWNTTVRHDPLGSTPTYVNGGVFELATLSPTGHLDTVTGTFVYHGGTITTLNPGANCTNQQYLVTGTLKDVRTTTTSGGSGSFSVVLTHFRTQILGRCLLYKSRIAGTVSFIY